MEKIIIAGGSGFLGKKLKKMFRDKNYDVKILSRTPNPSEPDQIYWDAFNPGTWQDELEGALAIINLTGKNINCRFTPDNMLQLLNSRLYSTKIIGKTIEKQTNPPKIWIQAGAVGFYGDRDNQLVDETSVAGAGFLADMCINWESIFNHYKNEKTRKVLFRIGVVLDKNEGAFPKLKKVTSMFLGARIGNGMQYQSWIHIDDLMNLFLFAIENHSVAGTFNAVAPEAIRNTEMMRTLRKSLNKPFTPPVPAFLIKLVGKITKLPVDLALDSVKADASKIIECGFSFKYREFSEAVKDLVKD